MAARASGSWDHRQDDVRRIHARVMDRVGRDFPLSLVVVIATRVEVAIETREVTARNLEANTMTRQEIIARRLQIDPDFVNFPLLHPDFLVEALAVTSAQNAFLNVEGCGVRVNIDKLGGEIRIQ